MKRKREVISLISFFVNNCKKILLFDKGIKSIRSFFVNKSLKGKFLQREKNVTLPFRNTVWNNPLHSPILNYILYQFNILHDFTFLFTSFFPSLSKSNLIRISNRRGAITIGRDVISCSARLGSTRLSSALSNSVELHLNGPCVIVDGHHLENPRFSDTGSIANRISRAFSLPFSPFSPPFFFSFSFPLRFASSNNFRFPSLRSSFFLLLRNLNIIRCHQFVFVSPLSDSLRL